MSAVRFTQPETDDLENHLGPLSAAMRAERDDAPEFFERFGRMTSVPAQKGALNEIDRALIGLAVVGNAAGTNWPRLESYARTALAAGATREQVRDVLRLVSIMSIHSMTVGVPALVGVLRERGVPTPGDDARRQHLRAQFLRIRGYWHDTWDDMLAMDPDMFEAYTAFSTVVAEHGSLDERLRELIYVAIDSIVTHLYVPGIEIHSRRALDAGATPEQLLTAMEIAALTGANPYFEAVDRLDSIFSDGGIG